MNDNNNNSSNINYSYSVLCVVKSYLKDCPNAISSELQRQLERTLDAYFFSNISFVEAQVIFSSSIHYTRPIDVLHYVKTVNDPPLPSISDLPPNAQSLILRKKSRPWTDIEDLRLLAGIYRYGLEAWGSVASFVGSSRTKSQCAQRWLRGIDPRISKNNWTSEEDRNLKLLVEKYGQKSWTKIAQEMPNRCDIQCRYRYRQLLQDENSIHEYNYNNFNNNSQMCIGYSNLINFNSNINMNNYCFDSYVNNGNISNNGNSFENNNSVKNSNIKTINQITVDLGSSNNKVKSENIISNINAMQNELINIEKAKVVFPSIYTLINKTPSSEPLSFQMAQTNPPINATNIPISSDNNNNNEINPNKSHKSHYQKHQIVPQINQSKINNSDNTTKLNNRAIAPPQIQTPFQFPRIPVPILGAKV